MMNDSASDDQYFEPGIVANNIAIINTEVGEKKNKAKFLLPCKRRYMCLYMSELRYIFFILYALNVTNQPASEYITSNKIKFIIYYQYRSAKLFMPFNLKLVLLCK